ncbi:TcpE family conjugal transfer membrane protein [Nocardiopsis alba]|uniref:TcpE family conjugal transfer membrane protein n=1 Tax=Nocardiopsis alba TaxID=53437 RepID=UPI003674DDF5
MDLPTYTNIWRIEKRLYKLYDFRLPMPLPVGTFGVALGVFALWVVLLSIVNAPFEFGNGWHLVLWVVPPGVITVLATRPVIEGKRLTELLISQARFLTEARVYTRLAPEYEPSEVRVAVRVWHRDPAAGPLPLPRGARRDQEAAETEEIEVSEEASIESTAPSEVERDPRAVGEAAPPLRGVAAPEPAAREVEPLPDPGDRLTEPEKTVEAPDTRVPVTAGAPAKEDTEGTRETTEGLGDTHVAMAAVEARESDDGARPGVGRRVLNYFGFALNTGGGGDGEAREKPEDDARDRVGGEGSNIEGDVFDEPVHATEEDERRDRDEWLARLRASSGETPIGLSSKSAYAESDTGAMSTDELASAVRSAAERSEDRRRAEEIMAAPEPTESRSESTAARRLRGRAQGIRVAKDLADRRERETGPVDVTDDTRVADTVEREPVRERVRPAEPPIRARGTALPATEDTDPVDGPAGPKGRPHAAPWSLDPDGADREGASSDPSSEAGGYPDLSDYAARYAEATGRPSAARDVSPAPWLPPASTTPEREEPTPAEAGRIGRTAAGPQASHATDGLGEARTETADRSGTGREPEGEGRTGHDSEWDEHMSVLDRHLIQADTPAPPRPKFADVVPAHERENEPTDDAEWFDDGKRRHPDQPKVGDRDNPVIPAEELREESGEREASADEPRTEDPEEETKPATQLDHGTGELVSFVEVRREPEPKPEPAREPETRERGTEGENGRPERTDAPVPAPKPEPAPEAVEVVATEAPEPAPEPETVLEKDPEPRTDVEPRTAPSTGTPTKGGEETAKPATQLDHGTGELVSFVEVRREPEPRVRAGATGTVDAADSTERSAAVEGTNRERVERPAPERPRKVEGLRSKENAAAALRPTEDELAEAEEAALRARRRADGAAEPAIASEPGITKETVEEDGRRTEPDPSDTSEDRESFGPHDPHDGVFHKVAQNARRIGRLFGQTVPGEEPEPPAPRTAQETREAREETADREESPSQELELDHGTGEHDGLGDTPGGGTARRVDPEPAEPAAEAAGDSGATRGWRRLARVVTGGAAPMRSDLPEGDIERLRAPLDRPRALVVLGCTGGAGQSVTALMLGHTLAAHRDDRVVAVDVNPGPNGLSRRVGAQAPETLTALLANADGIDEYERMRSYAGRAVTGLEVVQTLDDPYVQTLDDRDYGQLAELLGGFYGLTLLDPAATGVARALPVADGLVLVAPASADAERAVSMTFEWLDGNGYSALRANSVLVVNGVSKRSLRDVDAAERVARGRCRAIVRIPWDDHLGSSYTKIDVGALRPATKRAHGALGGVLVNSLISTPRH